MGGAVSFLTSVLAVIALAAAGSVAIAIVASVVALVALWSWLHMWYMARVLARQRLYVAALNRGEFEDGSPQATRYWHVMQIQVEPRDVMDVPDGIAFVNLVAALAAFVLLIWGIMAYWFS